MSKLKDFYVNSGLQNYAKGVGQVATAIGSGVKSYVKNFSPSESLKTGLKSPAVPLNSIVGAGAVANKILAPKPAPSKAATSITPPQSAPKNLTQSTPTATQKGVMTDMAGGTEPTFNFFGDNTGTQQVAGTSTTTPEVPLIAPKSSVDKTSTLREALLSTYAPSEEEKTLSRELTGLGESFRLGQEGIADQRIPLTDIQGQAASAERRYTNRSATLADRLALLQAERTGKQQRATKELEFAQGEKPIEAGGILYQRQADGTYKAITEKSPSASEGFTLSEGQVRYDAQGNPIAGTPKASATGEVSKQTLGLVNQLLSAGNIGSITGALQSPGVLIPGSKQQLLKNTYNQLKSLLSLENRALLKGSGAISDYEARVLEKAATKLGRNLSDKDFVAVLQELQRDLQGGGTSSVTLPSGEVINTNW